MGIFSPIIFKPSYLSLWLTFLDGSFTKLFIRNCDFVMLTCKIKFLCYVMLLNCQGKSGFSVKHPLYPPWKIENLRQFVFCTIPTVLNRLGFLVLFAQTSQETTFKNLLFHLPKPSYLSLWLTFLDGSFTRLFIRNCDFVMLTCKIKFLCYVMLLNCQGKSGFSVKHPLYPPWKIENLRQFVFCTIPTVLNGLGILVLFAQTSWETTFKNGHLVSNWILYNLIDKCLLVYGPLSWLNLENTLGRQFSFKNLLLRMGQFILPMKPLKNPYKVYKCKFTFWLCRFHVGPSS